jgi:cytochrome d ubiquinol oxidase subunit I
VLLATFTFGVGVGSLLCEKLSAGRVELGLVPLGSIGMTVFGASLSAFWILAANSWMQIPTGVHMEAGHIVVDDYFLALFNPDTLVTYLHKWLACIEASMFLIGGIAAWGYLKHAADSAKKQFFATSLHYVIIIAAIVAPLEVIIGDVSGLTVARYQPEKLAALELHYDTNAPGTGAALNLFAWPNQAHTGNAFAISVPNWLSLMVTHTSTGAVRGLNDFAADEKPNRWESIATFYSFRLMFALGTFLLALAWVGAWYVRKGRITGERLAEHPLFLRLWIVSIPLGLLAAEAGWMVREIGRQPWMIYHLLRVSDSLSLNLNTIVVNVVLKTIILLYLTLLGLLFHFTRKTVLKGPDLTSTIA